MIFLKKHITNSMILTLTENETVYSGEYYLTIENPQDHKLNEDIYLFDISLNPDRYNEFNVILVDDENESGFDYDDVTKTTTIYNLESGVYDYRAKDGDGELLEFGRLRVETTEDANLGTYQAEVIEHTYEG